ncbi:unnamed protein product, partial [Vitis vinifera]
MTNFTWVYLRHFKLNSIIHDRKTFLIPGVPCAQFCPGISWQDGMIFSKQSF